jgi:lipoate-protein ligase A
VCSAAAAALGRLGISARFRPRNDIETAGRKISGTGGAMISGAFMFQGTLLIENEIELFLKSLRVPVEKLKKREMESLLERICFLNDVVSRPLSLPEIKAALVAEFQEAFQRSVVPGPLTATESERLTRELPHFASDAWIRRSTRPNRESGALQSITQTDAGTLRVTLRPGVGGSRIGWALITGDFFAAPQRMANDLEAALVGVSLKPAAVEEAVLEFMRNYPGEFIGISPEVVAQAVGATARRKALLNRFTPDEANELFFVNLRPDERLYARAHTLLLPYCSKELDCEFRERPGCAECGRCEIGEGHELARSYGLRAATIQSFEHLMLELRLLRDRDDVIFVGSCCEAFFAKHQREMEASGSKGILVNLDSTTCYDLGKGTLAYKGRFDNKTELNTALLAKTLEYVHAP